MTRKTIPARTLKPKGVAAAGKRPRAVKKERASPRTRVESGGLTIKLRGNPETDGALTALELREELMALIHLFADHPPGTRYKWATFYVTPVDPAGAPISLNGPKYQTLTPYRSAADEHNAG